MAPARVVAVLVAIAQAYTSLASSAAVPPLDWPASSDAPFPPAAAVAAPRGAEPPIRFLHGTTTVAFRYRDGVIVAVDSRASMGSVVGSSTVRIGFGFESGLGLVGSSSFV